MDSFEQVPFVADLSQVSSAVAESIRTPAIATERFRQLPPAGSLPSLTALLGALRDTHIELFFAPGDASKVGRVCALSSRPLPNGETRDSLGLVVEPAGEGGEGAETVELVDVEKITGLRILDVSRA